MFKSELHLIGSFSLSSSLEALATVHAVTAFVKCFPTCAPAAKCKSSSYVAMFCERNGHL